MAPRLTRDEVLHIAGLARLALTDAETERFAAQLSEILAHAEVLNTLDTDAILPTAQVTALHDVTRSDQVQASLSPEEALANAPDQQDNLFRIRAVFEE
jgi:aspartyl-tRNA(Asn)/glutamyl-tRNA(Gln) amidotransferase subunit C